MIKTHKSKIISVFFGILFLVIINCNNLNTISGSDVVTSWGLQGIKPSQMEVFHDDINTNNWNLVDVSNFYFETPYSEHNNYLLDNYTFEGLGNYTETSYYIGDQDNHPADIFWDGTNWWMTGISTARVYNYTSDWQYTGYSYPIVDIPVGISWDGTNWWIASQDAGTVHKYTSDWQQTGTSYYLGAQDTRLSDIFWDGTNWWMTGVNSDSIHKYDSDWVYAGESFYIGTQDIMPMSIFGDGINWWMLGHDSHRIYEYDSNWNYIGDNFYFGGEDITPMSIYKVNSSWWMLGHEHDRVYKYYPNTCKISKNYFGNGYMYLQTNTTETIALQSVDYDTHYNLSNVYYFEVEFETNSDSQIDLILLKDGIINKTLILSQSGNTNFSQRTIQIFLNENAEFDQLKISGTLEDTDYVKVYDIKLKKDDTAPTININSPTLNELFGTAAPSFNVEIYDPNLDSMWYTLDNGLTNTTFTTNGTINQSVWDALSNGTATIIIYANDSAGNVAFSSLVVRVDKISPSILINSPIPNELFGTTPPSFNVEIYDANLDSMWYTLDNGLTNTTFITNGTINQSVWNTIDDGIIILTFYASDTAGNEEFQSITIIKDSTAPIKSPTIVELLAEADIFTQKTKTSNINVYDYSGSIPFLRLGLYEFTYDLGGYISEIYVRFNLPKIENIRSMILQLSYWDGYPIEADDNYEVNASLVSNDWIETTTIWTERPEYLGTSTLIYLNNLGLESEIYIDLMSLVEGLTDTMITIRLCPNNLSRIRFPVPFKSTESHGITPKLILEFDDPPTINSPTLNELFGTSAPSFNVEIYDPNLNSMWYTLDNGLTNTTFITNGTISQSAWDALPEGNVVLRFYANDSAGNIGFAEVTIRKDVTAPIITINNPQNSDVIGATAPNFDISIEEPNLDKTWYSVNGGNNITFTGLTGTINQALWDALLEGNVIIRFYANDSASNVGFVEATIRKEVTAPTININSPTPNELFGTSTPSFNVEIYDANLNSMWYTLDNGATNNTLTTNGTINQSAWDALPDGTVTITFYANDSAGNIGFAEVIIRKDVTTPTININSPTLNELFGTSAPSFNVEIYDANLDSMWYTLDNGLTNTTFTTNGTINQALWDALPDGNIIIKFYANDSAGNFGFAEVIIRKDVTTPTININSPTPNELFGTTAPSFSVEIYDVNLDSMWYTLDNGLTNTTFTSNGTINQVLWDALPEGNVVLRFYANDSAGNIGFVEVSVVKDATAPTIVINSPTDGEEFGNNAPSFNIVVTDDHLAMIWYSFDGGLTTYTTNTSFNQLAWSALPEGSVTITFYANDTLGNEVSEHVTVVKMISQPSPPGIPGYNILLLLGIISTIVVIIVKKRLNHLY